MNKHGTTVQCEKCKQWVSGSHNCEIWTTECERCAGSGEQPCNPCDKKHLNPNCGGDCTCPTCQGSGSVAIGVEEDSYEGYVPRYRPMTTLEVEEVIDNHKPRGTTQYDYMALFMDNAEQGVLTYKGQPCKLIPA